MSRWWYRPTYGKKLFAFLKIQAVVLLATDYGTIRWQWYHQVTVVPPSSTVVSHDFWALIALVKTYLDIELTEMHLAKDWSRCTQQRTDRDMTGRDALGKELAEICSTRTGQDALNKGPTVMCSSGIGRDTISNGLAKICSAKDWLRCAWQGLIEMCLEELVEMRSSKDWCDVLGKD
ncbi:hypothetical protein B296_00053518 [Ensete ventricosum]|uniref:Uncharacterized protein n=1 Tax=Ensete ventricosum TaxID=4639 RepID=A0A426Y0J8_ENSVE|nr:hypothetical protein B296_00053518 [Ensete ventricosum]